MWDRLKNDCYIISAAQGDIAIALRGYDRLTHSSKHLISRMLTHIFRIEIRISSIILSRSTETPANPCGYIKKARQRLLDT
jgi:hypothetical protein